MNTSYKEVRLPYRSFTTVYTMPNEVKGVWKWWEINNEFTFRLLPICDEHEPWINVSNPNGKKSILTYIMDRRGGVWLAHFKREFVKDFRDHVKPWHVMTGSWITMRRIPRHRDDHYEFMVNGASQVYLPPCFHKLKLSYDTITYDNVQYQQDWERRREGSVRSQYRSMSEEKRRYVAPTMFPIDELRGNKWLARIAEEVR